MKQEGKTTTFAQMALALSLLVGCFSIFSITFGLRQNKTVDFYETPTIAETVAENSTRNTPVIQKPNTVRTETGGSITTRSQSFTTEEFKSETTLPTRPSTVPEPTQPKIVHVPKTDDIALDFYSAFSFSDDPSEVSELPNEVDTIIQVTDETIPKPEAQTIDEIIELVPVNQDIILEEEIIEEIVEPAVPQIIERPATQVRPERYVLHNLEDLGRINARSFLVGDLDTGEIIFERKPHNQYPIASVTKFMTAYTAADNLKPNELAVITKSKLKVEGNRGRFKVGDKLSIRDLLYPLLLVSSNDAGEIIAEQRNRDNFLHAMNVSADKLGMVQTNFNDPTGLSKENVSSGRDLFIMMRAMRRTYPQIIDISRLSFKKNGSYYWRNINKASKISEFRGGKTGYTNAARQTSVGYYEVTLANNEKKNIGVVILQSNSRTQDTLNVIKYIKNNVEYL